MMNSPGDTKDDSVLAILRMARMARMPEDSEDSMDIQSESAAINVLVSQKNLMLSYC